MTFCCVCMCIPTNTHTYTQTHTAKKSEHSIVCVKVIFIERTNEFRVELPDFPH